MKKIILTQGKIALIDDDDYKKFGEKKWTASINKKRNGKTYAVRRMWVSPNKHKMLSLHREIMQPPKQLQVDHINGNTLDNRKVNLRICTNAENNWNKGKHRDNKSGFKGVYFFPWGNRTRRWIAKIYVNGKSISIGYFGTAQEAAEKYNDAAKKYHGQFASLN